MQLKKSPRLSPLAPKDADCKKLRMLVYPMSDLEHNQQIFSGLESLRGDGRIEFRYRYDGADLFGLKKHLARLNASASSVVVCRIDDIGDVAFDLSDGDVVVEQIYENCFLYFKRSYSNSTHGCRKKLVPLGLNYEAQSPLKSFGSAFIRALQFHTSPRVTGRSICRALHLPYPHILSTRTGGSLDAGRDHRVLFVTRVYDPIEQGSTSKERSEIASLNDVRAECVRKLRSEFGDAFTGGLIDDRFSRSFYGDCIVPPQILTDRGSFLKLICRHNVCVATTGLFGSIGWKFAEYLALGRAVVSEQLHYCVPGPFREGVNYLTFSTPMECAEQCRRLCTDPMKARQMMIANRAYYLGYVEPQAIVWNALQFVLALSDMSSADRVS